jgi:hypothetical protein
MSQPQGMAVEIHDQGGCKFLLPRAGELKSAQESRRSRRGGGDHRLALNGVEEHWGLTGFVNVIRQRPEFPDHGISEVAQVHRTVERRRDRPDMTIDRTRLSSFEERKRLGNYVLVFGATAV